MANPRTTIPGGAITNRRATEVANALDCSNGRGIAGAATTTTKHEQMSAPASVSVSAPTADVIKVVMRLPSPKRWRIAGPNRGSRRKSSDDSAEGEDHQQDKGRTRQWWRQSADCGGNMVDKASKQQEWDGYSNASAINHDNNDLLNQQSTNIWGRRREVQGMRTVTMTTTTTTTMI